MSVNHPDWASPQAQRVVPSWWAGGGGRDVTGLGVSSGDENVPEPDREGACPTVRVC